jgi:hypothetical protein
MKKQLPSVADEENMTEGFIFPFEMMSTIETRANWNISGNLSISIGKRFCFAVGVVIQHPFLPEARSPYRTTGYQGHTGVINIFPSLYGFR